MPWIGYEYWDPEKPEDDRFLSAETQRELIGQTIGAFAKLFSALPRSACAPGYRANDDTHRSWAQHGIRVAQNGPGALVPPHFDRHDILHLYRTVEFEPAVDPDFSVETCVRQAEACFERGIPAIVSMHSINFHSTAQDFRSRTLQSLDEFLTALELRHADLLYLHDEDILGLVNKGSYTTSHGTAGERDAKELHEGADATTAGNINEDQKSIVLVTVDCLRADHVGFMGYERPTTPFLDSLSARVWSFRLRLSLALRRTIRFPRSWPRVIRWRWAGTCWAWRRMSRRLPPS